MTANPSDRPAFEKWVDQNLENGLNDEQAAAVKAPPGNILVTARAGSGKTTVLTTRAVWLQRECDVSPSELLLLAFNKEAAKEMEKRLKPHFGEEMPHVMTFHALAHALVQPTAKILVDQPDPDQRAQTLKTASIQDTAFLRDKIEQLTRRKSVLLLFFDFFLDALNSIWQAIQGGDSDLAGKDEKRPRSLDTVTLHGDDVSLKGDPTKSSGERLISDALFLNDVEAIYEHPFDWNGNPYKPDFTIKTGDDSGVVIEYFGMLGKPSYAEEAEEKRQYWKDKPDWSLIELTPRDLASRGQAEFTKFLLTTLEEYGIKSRKLTPYEILEKSPGKLFVGRYTNALTAFVATCRHKNWDPAELERRIRKHTTSDKEERFFLAIAEALYSIYHDEVDGEEEEDFNGLLWKAVSKVNAGDTQFTRSGGKEVGDLRAVRHILIDEFQDFSEPFHELIGAIQAVNPKACVFAVGDDWQAINRFAGSDIQFFRDFERDFKPATRRHLTTNHRSTPEIVEVSNELMREVDGTGQTGRPGVASTTDSGEVRFWNLDFVDFLDDEHDRNRLISLVRRLIEDQLDVDRHVVMLSRTHKIGQMSLKQFENTVRSRLPADQRKKVTVSTTHRFKGCEEQAVIIIDANERRYPLVHPEWKFKRLFGETEEGIEDDERRLFYVALTRARTSLDIITNHDEKKSPFLGDIQGGVDYQFLERHPMLRVYTAGIGDDFKAVNAILKSAGFRFRGEPDNCWQKAIPAKQLGDYSDLSNERWYQPGVRFEVISATGKSLHTGKCGPAKPAASQTKDEWPETCPSCKRGRMKLRTARKGNGAGRQFYGCSEYPKCKHTRNK